MIFKCMCGLEDIYKVFLKGKGLVSMCVSVWRGVWGFFSFCTTATTGQLLARCQGGLASDFEVEHNR